MREQSLAKNPYYAFCCKYGGARARPNLAVMCTLNRLSCTTGDPAPRRGIVDVVSWFPGVLQQLWIDVSVPTRRKVHWQCVETRGGRGKRER